MKITKDHQFSIEQIQMVLKSLNILTPDQKMFLRGHYVCARPIDKLAKAYSISEEEAIKLGNSVLKDLHKYQTKQIDTKDTKDTKNTDLTTVYKALNLIYRVLYGVIYPDEPNDKCYSLDELQDIMIKLSQKADSDALQTE